MHMHAHVYMPCTQGLILVSVSLLDNVSELSFLVVIGVVTPIATIRVLIPKPQGDTTKDNSEKLVQTKKLKTNNYDKHLTLNI